MCATKSAGRIRRRTSHLLSTFSIVLLAHFSGPQASYGERASPSGELASPSGDPKAPTLFSRLEPAHTGIDLESRWAPEDPLSQRLMSSFAGSGVAVGDVDADGLPDLYFTRPNGGPKFYRNLGGFRFEDATATAGLAAPDFWCAGPCFADIDNDGDLDLHVCAQGGPNRLYLNDGKGHFTENAAKAGLDLQGNAIISTFADIDRDGDLDMYLVTSRGTVDPDSELGQLAAAGSRIKVDEHIADYFGQIWVPGRGKYAGPKIHMSGERDRLYENQGDGTFVDISERAGIHGHDIGQQAVWSDIDRDGDPDLYVTNDFTGPDRLWKNLHEETGTAKFVDIAPDALPMIPWFGMGCDAADIDNDGWPDLFASDMSATTHYKSKLAMGDMASTNWMLGYGKPRQAMRNALFLNSGMRTAKGTHRFLEGAFLAGLDATDWTWATLFGDYDGDGWQDLVVCNGMTRDWMNSDLGNNYDMERWIERKPLREKNFAFRNTQTLAFADVSSEWGLDHEGVSYAAAQADLDRDGDLDLVIGNFEGPPWIYRNNLAGGKRFTLRLHGTQSNRRGLGAKVSVSTPATTQTRELFTVRGFLSCSDDRMAFGIGQAERADIRVVWPSGAVSETEALAGSQIEITEPLFSVSPPSAPVARPLFAPVTELAESRHMEVPYDDFKQQPLLPNQLSALGPGLAVGDVDGDGDDDLYAGGAGGQTGRLFRNVDGQLERDTTTRLTELALVEEMGVLLLDLTRDGLPELFSASGSVEYPPGHAFYQDRLMLNQAGAFTVAGLPDVRTSSGPAAAADVDRDGDLDIFVGGRCIPGSYPAPAQSTLYLNHGSGLAANPMPEAAGLATAAVWSDSDNDGWLDLHVAYEWGSVRRWKNESGTLVEAPMPTLPGWWNSLIAADIDADGDMDLLAGNTGLNTKYTASPGQPARIYHGSFKPGTPKRIVEACFKKGTELPIRGKSCSTHAMPFLGDVFPTFDTFAKATLPDIYGERLRQDTTDTYEATELRSGAFVNDGTGRFTFTPFPERAQLSPIFGMAALDVDGDGLQDVVAAQNFFGPQVETGRFSGGLGLVLRNLGKGAFEAMSPRESGIVWPGDATALVVADFDADQRPELYVGQNDAPILRSELKGKHVAVRLLGPPGNPTAIGARLVANGSAREISAGSGYLSQSAPTVWFPEGTSRVDIRWPDGTEETVEIENGQARPRHPKQQAPPKAAAGRGERVDKRPYASLQAKVGLRFEEERHAERARFRYEEALRHDEKNVEALFGMGRLRYKAGDRRGALTYLEQALALIPGNSVISTWKTNIESELEKGK